MAFSEGNGLSTAEGKSIMEIYYNTFPELAAFFKNSGEEALKKNYVREPYFGRVRFFNKPRNGMEASHNKNAGMNYKPQAANGSILKYATALLKSYIEKHDLRHKVRILINVHDQIVSEAIEDFAEEWAKVQTELMEKAAAVAIGHNTIKVETDILDHWTKG